MLPELTVSSVEKKIEMEASVLVGNYEFYYACGKLAAKTALEADGKTLPESLKEAEEAARTSYTPSSDDTKEVYLLKLLERYQPTEEYEQEMEELFYWGKEGKRPNIEK